jgi:dephospho-CoA kinase
MAMNAPSPAKPVIGIVGGVGAGKSTVAAELGALGCAVIDADAVGHELLGEDEVRQALRQRWGDRVLRPDGSVDRKAVAAIVFSDADELAALNAVMHPRIRRRMERRIAAARIDTAVPAVAVDAAVLFEAGWDKLCTHVVFVSAGEDQRRQRVASRGWDEAAWRRREELQISLDTKRPKCDYTVENRSSVSYLREQIREIFHRIVSMEPSGGR